MSDGTIVGDFAVSASAATEDVSVPTGSVSMELKGDNESYVELTVPEGVKVVKIGVEIWYVDLNACSARWTGENYVKVTGGKTYRLVANAFYAPNSGNFGLHIRSSDPETNVGNTWYRYPIRNTLFAQPMVTTGVGFVVSWSPEINEVSTPWTDY